MAVQPAARRYRGPTCPTTRIRIVEISIGGIGALHGFVLLLFHPGILCLLVAPIELGPQLKSRGAAVFRRFTWAPLFTVPKDADLDLVAR